MGERPPEVAPHEARLGADQDGRRARQVARETGGPQVLPAPGAVAEPVTARVLQVQVPVDGPAVAPETGATEATVRDQGLQERVGRAAVGVAVARPVGAPARGPRRRVDLTHVEGRRDAARPSIQAMLKVRARTGDVGPVLGARTPVTATARPPLAIAVAMASPSGKAATRLVDHAGGEGASEDPAAPTVGPPEVMGDVARPLVVRAPPGRRRRAAAPVDGAGLATREAGGPPEGLPAPDGAPTPGPKTVPAVSAPP